MTESAGLVTLRFDAPTADDTGLLTWYRTAQARHASKQPGFALSRLYAVEDAVPRHLMWCETEAPVTAEQAAAWAPVAACEAMSFQLMRDVGRTSPADTPWLYIVHTDVPDDIVEEYNAWYDREHLPRLVTVPGVLRARRYAAVAGHPQYLTAYALTERDAFSSPAGLAARKTPWTERMRALFSNTRRLTCRLVVAY